MYDLIIKNGTVIDGSGRDAYRADICVSGDKIAGIGSFQYALTKMEIDAKELVVVPGFIDILNHSDIYLTLLTMPSQDSLITQGITTIVGGNCGFSLAPLVSSDTIGDVYKWANPTQINVNWLKMSEFLKCLEDRKLSVNFGTLTGFNTLLDGALKNEHRPPSDKEKEIINNLFEQSILDGSFGISLGLAYRHLQEDTVEGLGYIFETAKNKNIIVSAHLKDEWDKFLDSLAETTHIAKSTGVRFHISHLKVLGKKFWDNFDRAIEIIEKNAAEGLEISFDVFPYSSSSLMLYLLLPAWAKNGGSEKIIDRIDDPFDREQIINDLREQKIDYSKVTISSFIPGPMENSRQNMLFAGKTIEEIAKGWQTTNEDALLNLLSASKLKAVVFANLISEDNLQKAIKHPLSVITSSGAGYDLAKINSVNDLPHPKSFGAFPRLLRKYVKEKKLLSLKEAVEKITSRPAKLFGIKERGLIKENYFADLAIFDPEKIRDKATFQNPYQYSIGVNEVLVNGRFALHEGKFVKSFSGRVLKK